jgi:hypothetical protein
MTPLKRDLIDIVPTAESITSVQAHITGIFTEFDFMQSLEDDERKRLQRLGFRNETFSLGIIEITRQNPTLIPSRINLAQIGRDWMPARRSCPCSCNSRRSPGC